MKVENRSFISLILIFTLIFPSPLFAASVGGIVADHTAPPDHRPDVDQAPNGVPLVNIAAPSQSGLSHNQYSYFNVRNQGAILNNSTKDGQSLLGGIVTYNPNLGVSGSAKTILNEVTSSNRSQIQGYIEVFGQKADVILANPNGVTINGGGFINTDRATVTTGKPLLMGDSLRGFEVRQGDVTVEGLGINASNLTAFDIVSRASEINAEVHAQNLNIIAGQNRYDMVSGQVSALEADASEKPKIAIDTSLLGGMYAGSIRMLSTEKGVGVNLQGVLQSTKDMEINANGKLIVRAAKAEGDMRLAAMDHDLTVEKAAFANKAFTASGKNIEVAAGAALSAGTDIRLEAKKNVALADGAQAVSGKTLYVKARSAKVDKGATVASEGALSLAASGDISLAEGSLVSASEMALIQADSVKLATNSIVKSKTVAVEASSLDVQDASILAAENVTLKADSLGLSRTAVAAGKNVAMESASRITAEGANIQAMQDITLKTDSLDLDQASVVAGKSVAMESNILLKAVGAVLQAVGDLTLKAHSLALEQATVVAGNTVAMEGASQLAAEGANIQAAQDITLKAGSLGMDQATVVAGNTLAMEGTAALNAVNALFLAEKDLTLKAGTLGLGRTTVAAGNTMAMEGNTVVLDNSSVIAEGDAAISAGTFQMRGDAVGSLENLDLGRTSGVLYSGRNLSLTGRDSVSFRGGFAGSTENLSLGGVRLDAGERASLYSGYDMSLAYSGSMALDAVNILADGNLALTANALRLADSSLSSQGGLDAALGDLAVGKRSFLGAYSGLLLRSGSIVNEGLLFSGGDAALRVSGTLSNMKGADIFAQGTLQLTGADENSRMSRLLNNSANIESLSHLLLRADIVDNLGGSATVSQTKVGQAYLHIGMSDALPGYNADGSFRLVGSGEARYYRADKHAYGRVLDYTKEQKTLYGIPDGGRDHLQEWKTFYREEAAGDIKGAMLLAGRDMTVDANTLTNNLSTISAGQDLFIAADTLKNTGLDLYETAEVFRHFFSMGKHNEWEGSHTQTWTYSTLYKSIPAVLTAGRTLHINARQGYDSSGRANADYVGAYSGSPAYRGLSISGIGLNTPAAVAINTPAAIGALSPPVSPGGRPGFFMPDISLGGLFSLSANPNHPYLVESNPALTNMASFYGSDYFLTRIGYDLAAEQRKLLGDAFYETRLVREQLLAQTGQRYLFAGVVDDAQTMRLLMDNALEAGKAFGLSVGVSLSPEQVASLTKDIVWLEEAEYNGQTVLVPRLYLCEASRAELSVRGGTVTGESVVLEGNNIANAGMIRGSRVQISSLTDILNRGGEITGKNALFIKSNGSIINQSGTLGGGTVHLAAGKDIRMETLALLNTPNSNYTHTTLQQMAEIKAGGDVGMQAGNDIVFQGAKANIGGAALLVAGNDVQLVSTAATERYEARNILERREGNLGSEFSGGDIRIQAGQDVLLAGSSVKSDGNASLQAGRNIVAGAVMNEQESYFHISRGSSYKNTHHSEKTQSQGSAIAAEGNLVMAAGTDPAKGSGSITLVGSQASAQGSVDMQATGDVILADSTDSTYDFHSRSSKKTLSASAAMKESFATASVGSSISGDTVSIKAGDNVLLTGSQVAAKKDLTLTAERGDIVTAAAQNTYEAQSKTSKSKFTPEKLLHSPLYTALGKDTILYTKTEEKAKNTQVTNSGSVLSAGSNLTLDAGRDVSVIGSLAEADKDLWLQAGRDVNILPGRENFVSEYSKKKTEAGLWSSLGESGLSLFAGVKAQTQGVERTGAYSAGSLISAGRDVLIGAGRDVNQSASQIEAGQDAVISAGQDWNMTAAFDYETLHQYVSQVQSGLSAAVEQNVSSATRTFLDMPHSAMQGQGNVAFQGLTAASAYLRTVDSLRSAYSQPISASVNIGASFSRTDYKASSNTARPSAVLAGRDVEAATGRDIIIEGGKVAAGENVILDAGRDLNILAARNGEKADMASSSGGAAVGLKAVVGSGGVSFGVNAQANAAGAESEGQGTSHTNALLTAGNTFYGKSGRDSTVAGARLEADKVWMDVGENLTVASLQDSYESKSTSWSAGADVTVGYGINISGNFGFGRGKSDSDWVGEQSAIIGRKEVDLYVGKNTQLKGSIIGTDKGGSLTLDTGTLSYGEIRDKDTSSAWNAGIAGGFSTTGGFAKPGENDLITPINYADNGKNTPYTPNSVEFGYASSDKSGVLRPTVSEGTITVRDAPDTDLSGLNRELERAREVTRDETTKVDVYVPRFLLEALFQGKDMMPEPEEILDETGFWPNLFIGMGINASITGKEYWILDKDLDFDEDQYGNNMINPNASYWSSDQNPFLKVFYHIVPGGKSATEIHDRQTQKHEAIHGKNSDSLYPQLSIPGSFAKSYLGALIGIMDVPTWGKAWNNHIKPSYTLRTEEPSTNRSK